MNDQHERRCIYCREIRPPSKEHILQKSLGGDFTTTSLGTAMPVVCRTCNEGFSAIDQSLAERSLMSLYRIAYTHQDAFPAQLGGEHFYHDADSDLWLEAKLLNHATVHLPAQLHRRDRVLSFHVSSSEAQETFLKLLRKKHGSRQLAQTHIKLGPPDRCTSSRLIQHRSDAFFVRAIDAQQGKELLDAIEVNWDTLARRLEANVPIRPVERPSVHVSFDIHIDDNYRAIAKSAFNYLAMATGPTFVLRPEFDDIRRYILGREIVHDEVLPGAVAFDRRFVMPLKFGAPPVVPTDAHAIVLLCNGSTLVALVTLYRNFSFEVTLGHIALPERLFFAHEFSTDRTGHSELDWTEVLRRWQHAKSDQAR